MVEIVAKIKISAVVDKVWKVVSTIENDPLFWKSLAKVKNISKNRNEIIREVILKNSEKCDQKIILFPSEGLHIRWLKGTIIGTKDIMLTGFGNETILEIDMNYRLRGVASMLSRRISEDLRDEAQLALQLIKERIEGTQISMENRKHWADLIPR